MTEPEEQPVIPTDITVDKAHYEDVVERCDAAERKRDAIFAALIIKDRTAKALVTTRKHLSTVLETLCLALLTDQIDEAKTIAKAALKVLRPIGQQKPPTSAPSDSSSPTPLMNTSPAQPEPANPSPPTN